MNQAITDALVPYGTAAQRDAAIAAAGGLAAYYTSAQTDAAIAAAIAPYYTSAQTDAGHRGGGGAEQRPDAGPADPRSTCCGAATSSGTCPWPGH